jgi:hypothetical protein
MGKGRFPGGRRPVGEEPKSKTVDGRQKGETDPQAQMRVSGFTKGGTFRPVPAREVGGAFRQAVQEAPEAIERQRIPADAADMAKGYFQRLGNQKN